MKQELTFSIRKVLNLNSSDIKKLIGKQQFNQSVFYTYNEVNNTFMFFTPTNSGVGREILPIGIFSPLVRQKIPYDPQEVVETIADVISRSDFEFDIDELEDED